MLWQQPFTTSSSYPTGFYYVGECSGIPFNYGCVLVWNQNGAANLAMNFYGGIYYRVDGNWYSVNMTAT